MGLEKFQIIFENPYGVYYGGQNISGRILVVVASPKKIRGISVKIKGEAEVKWTESRSHASTDNTSNNTQQNEETFSNEEVYFENKVNVYGGANDQTLPAGEHAFPFSYVLPSNIPSSFEGEHGHVRYTVRAVIDRPWKFDHETKIAFTVICPLDLNANPKLSEPIQNSKEKSFCCLCCASGPLTVNLTLPAGGAVPGETLLPTLEVDNTSNVYLTQIKLCFVKSVTYRARGNTKTDDVNISEKSLGYVDARKSQTWTNEPLAIPSLPPSDLTNCSIIDLNYYVKATIIPAGIHHRVTVPLPVILGTIPFHQRFGDFSSAPAQPPLGWNLAPSAPMRDGSPNYPDLPPPSYMEAVTGAKSLFERGESEHVQGDKSYAPRYPVYSHQPPPFHQ